jgi:Asp-tRNA(Asn)/Glu-tRNA(Gln) amidotransferase A subunit family amidase
VLSAEALAIHAQFAGREHLHRSEFTRFFYEMTEGMGSALDYVLAQAKRADLVATWRALFAQHRLDAVIEPGAASEIRDLVGDSGDAGSHPLDVTVHPWFFGMWNDANFPVLSLPAGPSPKDGGPVGMQIVGLPFSDAALLQIGIDYQGGTGHHSAQPPGLDDHVEPYRPPVVPDGGPQPAYVPPRNPFEAVILPA